MANRLISVGDTSYLPPSIRVDEVNLPTGVKSAVVAGKVGKGDLMVNVLDYGAVADATDAGGTDNTSAFQDAMDAAWNGGKGGTLLIPPGAYKLADSVIVRSNVRIIGYGATLRKYSNNTSYSSFQALSNGSQGYGSSAVNVTFEGLTFRGKFGSSACGNAVTLHHARGVTFRKCTWTEAILSGHAIDLMGCDGVLVDDCTFAGFSPQVDREYVEAIQVDYSMADGGGSDTTNSFDGLGTINVTAQNNRFVPLVVGATPYPAPNPIGSHSRVVGRWLENITFDNNWVEGGDANLATAGFTLWNRGWIHFLCARNVKVTRNTFKNVGGIKTKVVFFNTIGTGTAIADVQTKGAVSVSMPVMPVEDFTFDDNTLIGFTNDTEDYMVDVRGTDASAGGINAKRIKIRDNTVKDSYSTPGVTGDKGAAFVYLQDVAGATITGNELENTAVGVYAFRSKRITVEAGNMVNLGSYAGRFSTCNDITIRDVNVDGHGGGYWFYNACVGVKIMGGSILNGRSDALKQKHISISAGNGWMIGGGIRIPKDSNGYTSAIDAYTTSTRGVVSGVFAAGWDAGTLLSLGAASTTANYDRNVY